MTYNWHNILYQVIKYSILLVIICSSCLTWKFWGLTMSPGSHKGSDVPVIVIFSIYRSHFPFATSIGQLNSTYSKSWLPSGFSIITCTQRQIHYKKVRETFRSRPTRYIPLPKTAFYPLLDWMSDIKHPITKNKHPGLYQQLENLKDLKTYVLRSHHLQLAFLNISQLDIPLKC